MNYEIVSNFAPASVCDIGFTPTVAIGFYVAGKEEEVVEYCGYAHALYPNLDFIGCSSESNIYHTLPHIDSSNHSCIFVLLEINPDAYHIETVGCSMLEEWAKTPPPFEHANALFFDLPNSCSEATIECTQKRLGEGGMLYGMIAGTPDPQQMPTLFYNGRFIHHQALICSIDSRYYAMHGVSLHTFEPIGLRLEITKALGHRLYELEGRPALEVIEEIIGEIHQEEIDSFEHPLFLFRKDDTIGEFSVLSSIASIDREEGSIILYKGVSESYKELKISTPLGVIEEEKRFQRLFDSQLNRGILFLFACIGMKQFLGTREHIRLITLAKYLNHPFIGCHAFGEVGPSVEASISQLQNQTFTLCSLYAKESV